MGPPGGPPLLRGLLVVSVAEDSSDYDWVPVHVPGGGGRMQGIGSFRGRPAIPRNRRARGQRRLIGLLNTVGCGPHRVGCRACMRRMRNSSLLGVRSPSISRRAKGDGPDVTCSERRRIQCWRSEAQCSHTFCKCNASAQLSCNLGATTSREGGGDDSRELGGSLCLGADLHSRWEGGAFST